MQHKLLYTQGMNQTIIAQLNVFDIHDTVDCPCTFNAHVDRTVHEMCYETIQDIAYSSLPVRTLFLIASPSQQDEILLSLFSKVTANVV